MLAVGLSILVIGMAVSISLYRMHNLLQQQEKQLNQHASRMRHYGVLAHELQRLRNDDLRRLQTTSETLVDGGTKLVKNVHMGIANVPFSILEAIPVTRDTSKLVRGIHDVTSNTVYTSIRGTNKAVGAGLRLGLHARKHKTDD